MSIGKKMKISLSLDLDVDENDPSIVSLMATMNDPTLSRVARLAALQNLAVKLGEHALSDYGGLRLSRDALRGSVFKMDTHGHVPKTVLKASSK